MKRATLNGLWKRFRGAPVPHSDLDEQQSGTSPRWLVFLVFLALSSLLLTALLEWPRYHYILSGIEVQLSGTESFVLFWLLWAKTLAVMFPAMILVALLERFFNLRRGEAILGIAWMGLFFYMIVDLLSMTVTGAHISTFFPYVADMILSPELICVWAPDAIGLELLVVFLILMFSGAGLFLLVRWFMNRLFAALPSFRSREALWPLVVILAVLSAGVVPALAVLHSRESVDRFYETLPFNAALLETATEAGHRLLSPVSEKSGITPRQPEVGRSGLGTWAEASTGRRVVELTNRSGKDFDLDGYEIAWSEAASIPLKGVLRNGEAMTAAIPRQGAGATEPVLLDRRGGQQKGTAITGGAGVHLTLTEEAEPAPEFSVSEEERLLRERFGNEHLEPSPVDPDAKVTGTDLPNVVLLILESWRHSALSPTMMKRLHAWSEGGLRCEHHYSGEIKSQGGIFALIHGKVPVGYRKAVEGKLPPQLCVSLRNSGYRTSFLMSAYYQGWRDMELFLNKDNFDILVFPEKGKSLRGVPDEDLKLIEEIQNIFRSGGNQPQFAMAFFNATHYPYYCPKEFELHEPLPKLFNYLSQGPIGDMNRYRNACLFMEDAIMKLTANLDPKRTIVIITGDHGESFGEDGHSGHGSSPSDIQSRVPFVMVGPGIRPEVIRQATSHADLTPTLLRAIAGKPVAVRNTHGRDLLDPAQRGHDVAYMANDLVVVRGNKRMQFNRPDVRSRRYPYQFVGFLSKTGRLKRDSVPETTRH